MITILLVLMLAGPAWAGGIYSDIDRPGSVTSSQGITYKCIDVWFRAYSVVCEVLKPPLKNDSVEGIRVEIEFEYLKAVHFEPAKPNRLNPKKGAP